jgi:hypothetical protein
VLVLDYLVLASMTQGHAGYFNKAAPDSWVNVFVPEGEQRRCAATLRRLDLVFFAILSVTTCKSLEHPTTPGPSTVAGKIYLPLQNSQV